MLLVDDEEPRPRQRHEYRGARSHHHVRGAVARVGPRREPLAVGQSGVKRRHAAGQPRVKAGEELRCEADLRNEHQHLTPEGDDLLDQPQVHLRLAAAGDAFEHERAEFLEVRLHRLHRASLLGVRSRAIRTIGRVGPVGHFGDGLHPAFRDQRPQRPAPVPMLGGERGFRDAPGVEHEAEQTGLDRRTANPLGEGARSGGARRVPHGAFGPGRTPEPQQSRQRTDDDLADGMLKVSAGPCEQLQRRRIEQRLRIDDVAHALET